MIFLADFVAASSALRSSHGNLVGHRLRPDILRNPFTCRVQNLNIPRAVRVRAEHGGAAGHGGARQNRTPTGRVAQKPTVPLALQGIVDNCPECPLVSTNKGNRI